MARRRDRMTVGSKYVAIGALTELVNKLTGSEANANSAESALGMGELGEWLAPKVIDAVWDVEHFPVAGKVCITIDLGRLEQPVEPAVEL